MCTRMRACMYKALQRRDRWTCGALARNRRGVSLQKPWRRVKECRTGSCFFFYIPHSEFDIYYHYFCRLYNSGTLPFQSARVEQRSFGGSYNGCECVRLAPYKCSRFRAQFEYYIKYTIPTQYITLCSHCITPEITQQR